MQLVRFLPVDSAAIRAEEGIADPTVLLETIAMITDARWVSWLNGHIKKGSSKIRTIKLRTRKKKPLTVSSFLSAFGLSTPAEANDPDWRPPPKE